MMSGMGGMMMKGAAMGVGVAVASEGVKHMMGGNSGGGNNGGNSGGDNQQQQQAPPQ